MGLHACKHHIRHYFCGDPSAGLPDPIGGNLLGSMQSFGRASSGSTLLLLEGSSLFTLFANRHNGALINYVHLYLKFLEDGPIRAGSSSSGCC